MVDEDFWFEFPFQATDKECTIHHSVIYHKVLNFCDVWASRMPPSYWWHKFCGFSVHENATMQSCRWSFQPEYFLSHISASVSKSTNYTCIIHCLIVLSVYRLLPNTNTPICTYLYTIACVCHFVVTTSSGVITFHLNSCIYYCWALIVAELLVQLFTSIVPSSLPQAATPKGLPSVGWPLCHPNNHIYLTTPYRSTTSSFCCTIHRSVFRSV